MKCFLGKLNTSMSRGRLVAKVPCFPFSYSFYFPLVRINELSGKPPQWWMPLLALGGVRCSCLHQQVYYVGYWRMWEIILGFPWGSVDLKKKFNTYFIKVKVLINVFELLIQWKGKKGGGKLWEKCIIKSQKMCDNLWNYGGE